MDLDDHDAARTIAVVGGGFSGAVTAIQLMRLASPEGVHVKLVNKSGRMARGIAYGTRSSLHVLNVPAGNMSALANDPDDFLRFCRWSDPAVGAASFVSRRLYGTYLEALLTAAEHADERPGLDRIAGEVTRIDVDQAAKRVSVVLDDGRRIAADHVVLAFGHFAPADPGVGTRPLPESQRYVRDPWAHGALRGISSDEPVLLLGSGLTAIDVALALQQAGRNAPTWCLSRRGLRPQAHRSARAAHNDTDVSKLLVEMGSTVRGAVRAVRQHVERHAKFGEDWRDVLAALRPHTPELWRRWPARERKRFMRHVQPYWDVLRHRCAPAPFEQWRALLERGAISVIAGRLLDHRQTDGGIEVTLRRRGMNTTETLRAAWVINCTGSASDVRNVGMPLVRQLLSDGLIRCDALGLGIEVSENYEVIDAAGNPIPLLSYIGPLLKARDWEATAVPELREHAWRLAKRLLVRGNDRGA